MLSVIFNKYKAKHSVRDSHKYSDNRQTQGQIQKIVFKMAQIKILKAKRGKRMEDTRSRK